MADKCNYRNAAGEMPCRRPREVSDTCFFHYEHNALQPASQGFSDRLSELIREGDGDWQGFVFPRSLELQDVTANFEIDCSHATIGALKLTQCRFAEKVSFTQATFSGQVNFGTCEFAREVTFANAVFAGALVWSSRAAALVSFGDCLFRQPVQVYGQLNGGSVWDGAHFFDSVDFNGGWIIYMSAGGEAQPNPPMEPHGLFAGITQIQSVDFHRPEWVRLNKVDLSRAFVRKTNFRGVSFHNTSWADIRGRRAIYDEVWDRETPTVHAPLLGEIEPAYRSIRVALEEGKDFSTASDFYYGEMDARRRQMHWYRRFLFSIEAAYFALSGYGCRPLRALGWLIVVIALHGLATGSLLYGAGLHFPDPDQSLLTTKRTLSLLVPASFDDSDPVPLTGWWFLVDVVFGVWAVVQSALFALSLRARIKRG